MKKLVGLSVFMGLLILPGCLDTVEETTMNEDGSGVYTSIADMSKLLSIVVAMGGNDEKTKELQKLSMDTTMMLATMQDSSMQLTDEEKKLIEKGTARVIINMKDEKLTATFNIPFSKPADIPAINSFLKSSKANLLQKQMKNALPGGGQTNEDMDMFVGGGGGQPDISDYFDFTYERSKLKKKLNKEKYAKIEEDDSLKNLMEMGQMGMPVSFKTVINLPKPAKKAEGKGVILSDDKKRIIIEGTLEDFMEDASKFEYEIEF
jgi:hypothetical protein